ncbi:type II secretion system protein GspI [Pseudomonas sp. MF6776]|nr:type II secretion system protein GspI [Pseudomonas sp. MF6776]
MGMKAQECDQGRLLLRCELVIGSAENGRLLKVGIQVLDRSQGAPPLARLETLLSRTENSLALSHRESEPIRGCSGAAPICKSFIESK